jgi:SWI/SNF-related matrix-associated actin-dependent regulator of chromatin subfamily A member 5
LDGSTNRVQRAVDVLQYNQADSSHFAYLMSTRAGGLGINLATADTVILYDSDWNPQVDLQAMDRVHRIGQEKPVHVYRLVTKGTIEERIVQRAKKKLFLDSMVNRGSTAQGEALETLSKAEMLKMLKFGASAVFGGENGDAQVKLLTDHELNKMVDRSEAAMKERTTSADTSSAASQDNAHDFDMEKIQPVRLRDMYGKDFVQEATAAGTLSTEGAASPTQERPVKKARVSSAKKKKEADPVESVQDIAKQWNSTKGASTKSGRKVKSRFTKVGGHNVLHANTYSLEEGEKSVFASELANRRRGPDAATLEEINRSLGRGRQVAGRDYTNEQHCLSCWDGGELILCDQCPVAVHPECINADQAPPAQRKGTPTWRCPHHMCSQCDRKSAAAGGLLFRCSECLNAYCEDHLPLEGVRLHEDGRCLRFEELGFRKPTQGYYILCSKNCQTFYNERVELGLEEAIRRAVERLEAVAAE